MSVYLGWRNEYIGLFIPIGKYSVQNVKRYLKFIAQTFSNSLIGCAEIVTFVIK